MRAIGIGQKQVPIWEYVASGLKSIVRTIDLRRDATLSVKLWIHTLLEIDFQVFFFCPSYWNITTDIKRNPERTVFRQVPVCIQSCRHPVHSGSSFTNIPITTKVLRNKFNHSSISRPKLETESETLINCVIVTIGRKLYNPVNFGCHTWSSRTRPQ